MIQVLMRAFRVLEAVSHAPERVWQLRELAEIAGVKPDTCFHIVRTMCSLGWLESPGPRKGYRLGPELNELCGGVIYRFELATHAKLQLRAFADRFRIPVMLAGINGSRRYIAGRITSRFIIARRCGSGIFIRQRPGVCCWRIAHRNRFPALYHRLDCRRRRVGVPRRAVLRWRRNWNGSVLCRTCLSRSIRRIWRRSHFLCLRKKK